MTCPYRPPMPASDLATWTHHELRAEVEQQRKQWEDIWRRNVDLLAEIQRLEDALDTCRELREFDAATIARLRSVKEM